MVDAGGMSIDDAAVLPQIGTGGIRARRGSTPSSTGQVTREAKAAGRAPQLAVLTGWGGGMRTATQPAGAVVTGVGLSPAGWAVMRAGLADPRVVARYRAKVAYGARDQCWHFTGAIHPHGHGRFFVGQYTDTGGVRRDVVVIAHRFGWALAYGAGWLEQVPVLAHDCDEAGCQNPAHLSPATMASNHHDWDTRRWQLGSPLRDVRGAAGRARAIRAAILGGHDVAAARSAGISPLDRDQLPLW